MKQKQDNKTRKFMGTQGHIENTCAVYHGNAVSVSSFTE